MRLRILTFLAGIEALAAAVYMLMLPADPKNQFLWGFSIYRLTVLAILIAFCMIFVFLSFWQKGNWPKSFSRLISETPTARLNVTEDVLFVLALLGLGASLAPLLKPIPDLTAIHERLLPLLAWATLVAFETLLVFLLELKSSTGLKFKDHLIKRWLMVPADPTEQRLKDKYSVFFVLLLTLAVLLPSVNAAYFSGFPLSTLANGIALFLIIPLWFSGRLRDLLFLRLDGFSHLIKPTLGIALGLVVILKTVLLFSGLNQGFSACFHVLHPHAPPERYCELSYENPTYANQVTRYDREIYFDASNWNLSFLNTLRYDSFRNWPGDYDRNRWPFTVSWAGTSDLPEDARLSVTYIGEAELKIGEELYNLPPNYSDYKSVDLKLPNGEQAIQIKYTFDDQYRIGDASIPGPGAMFRASIQKADGEKQALGAVDLPLPWNMICRASDLLLWLVLIVLGVFYLLRLLPAWRGLFIFALLSVFTYWALPELNFMWVMLLLYIWVLCWRGEEKMLLAYIMLGFSLYWRVLVYFPNAEYNLLRFGGTDMLTYEGFARYIFESGSLEAGEKTFYYQAAFRYIVHLLHLIFGESDSVRSFFMLLAMNMGLFLNINFLSSRKDIKDKTMLWLGWGFSAAIILLSNASLVFYVQHGISETVSWICFLYVFYIYLVYARSLWPVAAALIGVGVFNRYNHLPALIFLFLFFNWPDWQKKKKSILISFVIIGAILALIPIHNIIYGGKFEIMPTSADASVNLILPPQKLLNIFGDPTVLPAVLNQTRILFGFVSWKLLDLCIPIFGIWTMWLGLGGFILARWKQFSAPARWIWLLPGLYFGSQFFFYMLANYPRHLYAAYLAASITGLYICWFTGRNSIRGKLNPSAKRAE